MSTADVMAGDQPAFEGGVDGGGDRFSTAADWDGRGLRLGVSGWERGLVRGADGWRDFRCSVIDLCARHLVVLRVSRREVQRGRCIVAGVRAGAPAGRVCVVLPASRGESRAFAAGWRAVGCGCGDEVELS